MNEDQELAQAINHSAQDGQGAESNIARSVMTKANWGQRVLSPWVQRTLATASGEAKNKLLTNNRQPLVTLTGGHTSSLLNRLQRMADESAVWRPDIGASRPETVDRFTSTIINRFAQTKVQPPPIVQRSVAEADLTLAGAALFRPVFD